MNNIDFHFDKPEDNSGYLLWQTTMIWQRQMNRELSKIGLTHTQFVILASLAWLSKRQNKISQKDIADDSNTDRMMVSKILGKLQQKKYIKRQENEKDTRSKLVFLTEKGVIKLQIALRHVEITDNKFFSEVAEDKYFNHSLSKLIASNSE
ncbi:MAG: MarR family transcriptional regulator [Bacteroidota bacterium]